jgi:hypothetical protein
MEKFIVQQIHRLLCRIRVIGSDFVGNNLLATPRTGIEVISMKQKLLCGRSHHAVVIYKKQQQKAVITIVSST